MLPSPVPRRLHVERWGYPYVMDDYRFHMTLTGSTRAVAPRQIEALLVAYMQDMPASHSCVDAVCLFEQDRAEQPFVVTERIAFGEVSR